MWFSYSIYDLWEFPRAHGSMQYLTESRKEPTRRWKRWRLIEPQITHAWTYKGLPKYSSTFEDMRKNKCDHAKILRGVLIFVTSSCARRRTCKFTQARRSLKTEYWRITLVIVVYYYSRIPVHILFMSCKRVWCVHNVYTLSYSPVMAILHDHLDVPSSTACSTAFMFSRCALAETLNMVLQFGERRWKGRCKEEHDITFI